MATRTEARSWLHEELGSMVLVDPLLRTIDVNPTGTTLVSWDEDLRRAAAQSGCAVAPAG
jgi:hypothetical protein